MFFTFFEINIQPVLLIQLINLHLLIIAAPESTQIIIRVMQVSSIRAGSLFYWDLVMVVAVMVVAVVVVMTVVLVTVLVTVSVVMVSMRLLLGMVVVCMVISVSATSLQFLVSPLVHTALVRVIQLHFLLRII